MSAVRKIIKAPTRGVVFVCQKCDGGKDLRRALKSAVKGSGRKRDVRVVGCGCLGVCPKHAVTVARTAADGPTTFAIVDRATALEDVLAP